MSKFDIKKTKEYHDWIVDFLQEGDILYVNGTVRTKIRKVISVEKREWKHNYIYRKNEEPNNQGSGAKVICNAYYDLSRVLANEPPYQITEHLVDKISKIYIDGKFVDMKRLYNDGAKKESVSPDSKPR